MCYWLLNLQAAQIWSTKPNLSTNRIYSIKKVYGVYFFETNIGLVWNNQSWLSFYYLCVTQLVSKCNAYIEFVTNYLQMCRTMPENVERLSSVFSNTVQHLLMENDRPVSRPHQRMQWRHLSRLCLSPASRYHRLRHMSHPLATQWDEEQTGHGSRWELGSVWRETWLATAHLTKSPW